MHNKCSKTWREALTRGPGQHDDDLEGLAGAAMGQVDDERGQPPVAARSDAHGDVEGEDVGVGVAVGADAAVQLVPQLAHGPPREMELGPAVLGDGPLGARSHEPDQPPHPSLASQHVGELSGSAALQSSRRKPWSFLCSGDQEAELATNGKNCTQIWKNGINTTRNPCS